MDASPPKSVGHEATNASGGVKDGFQGGHAGKGFLIERWHAPYAEDETGFRKEGFIGKKGLPGHILWMEIDKSSELLPLVRPPEGWDSVVNSDNDASLFHAAIGFQNLRAAMIPRRTLIGFS